MRRRRCSHLANRLLILVGPFGIAGSASPAISLAQQTTPGTPVASPTSALASGSAGSGSAPAAAGAMATTLARLVRDTALANGLKVIAIENHAAPLVTAEVVVHTGAFTQEPGDEGVPHLYEHMLFKSYSGPGDRSWGQSMGEIDGSYNGETGDESVRYFVTAPSDKAEGALRSLAELVRDPEFTQDNLNEERRVVFDELDRDRSNPVQNLFDQVNQRLWTKVWGRKDPGGDPKSLHAVTPKQLKQIFTRYYVPNNAAVIVSGDITPARAFELADERFGHWKRHADPFANVTPYSVPPLERPAAVIVQDDVADVLLVVEWQGPSVTTEPDATYAADMLSAILDDPGSSFHQHLIDTGLFASCSIQYTTRSHVGPITLVAHTSLDSLNQALTVLAFELHRLDSPDAFTDEELLDARRARRVELALSLQHSASMADFVAELWSSAGLDYFRNYEDRMAAVSRADLQKFAKRYIVGAPVAAGLLVPPGKGNGLREAVSGFINWQ